MKRWPFRRWTLEERLAAVALVLGLVAVAGEPTGGATVTLDTRELAAIVESEQDHVTVDELAEWIVAGRNDYRLLDVRDPESYAEYHIPTAESVSLTGLADHPLLRNETIVLYSDGGMHSAQAWFLLRARGYQGASILLYGLEEWKSRILFPALPAEAGAAERADFERRASLADFFGGKPRSASETAVGDELDLPAPPPAAAAPVVVRKRKRKEGC